MALAQADVDKLSLQDAVEAREKLFRETIEPMRKEFNDNNKTWKDEARSKSWSEANDDFNLLTRHSDKIRAAEDVEKQFRENNEILSRATGGKINPETGDINKPKETDITTEDRNLAFQGWCRYQMEGIVSRRQKEALKKVGMRSGQKSLRGRFDNNFKRVRDLVLSGRVEEARALSATTATSGAEFVPEGFVRNLEISMLDYSGILQVADILRTGSGNDIPWPTMNDTGNKGRLLAESAATTATDPATNNVTLGAYKFSSDSVLVPYELLEDEDVAPELPSILNSALAERLGRIIEQYCTTGTGSSQPNGIVTAASLGKTAASATAITFPELINLEHSVDPAYRNGPGVGYMMNDAIVEALRLINDSDGRPLWTDGSVQEGTPSRLHGRPAYINQEMASSIATTAKTVLFGQLSKYKVRQVNNIRFYRLEERYRDNDQDGFVAFIRLDGDLLDAGTDPVKYLQQA